MSITTAKIGDVVKKQYKYKMKIHIGAFTSMMLIQLLAIFLSYNGTAMMGSSSERVSYSVHYYNGDIIVIFTMIWAFVTGIVITTKQVQRMNVAFVSTPLTNHLSNIGFLVTMSVIGSVSAILASQTMQVIFHFIKETGNMIVLNDLPSLTQFLLSMISTTLYILLISTLGYIAGVFVQISKLFIILLPALIISSIYFEAKFESNNPWDLFVTFFSREASVFLFTIKILSTVIVLYVLAIFISKRLEVPR